MIKSIVADGALMTVNDQKAGPVPAGARFLGYQFYRQLIKIRLQFE